MNGTPIDEHSTANVCGYANMLSSYLECELFYGKIDSFEMLSEFRATAFIDGEMFMYVGAEPVDVRQAPLNQLYAN